MSDSSPVVVTHRVIYGDTDAMGIVYYGNYMRFLEIGRTEYLRAGGRSYKEVEDAGYAIPVAEVGLRYMAPARYDDLLEIATHLEKLSGASIRFGYRITCEGELLAKGFTRHACVDRSKGRAVRLPPEVIEILQH